LGSPIACLQYAVSQQPLREVAVSSARQEIARRTKMRPPIAWISEFLIAEGFRIG